MSSCHILSCLNELKKLPASYQRAVGAIMGAVVADAATRPFHWVYDQNAIEDCLSSSSRDSLEFWDVSVSPFYDIPTGRLSCYSDECVSMLKSLPTSEEPYSHASYVMNLQNRFSPDSDYAQALRSRMLSYDGSQRETHKVPSLGPWQNQSVTTFLKTGMGEETINESDGICGAMPLVSWLAVREDHIDDDNGEALFDSHVKEAITTLSASKLSMEYSLCMAHLIRRTIVTDASDDFNDNFLRDIISHVKDNYNGRDEGEVCVKMQEVLAADREKSSFVSSIAKFGKACAFPGSFQGSLLTVLTSTSYSEGVKKNIRAGGCNCSRANMAGALMGARWGVCEGDDGHGVPQGWILNTTDGLDMLERTVTVFKHLYMKHSEL